MAGASITLDLVSDDITLTLQRLLGFSDDGLGAALGEIGELLVRSTRDRASDQVDPGGNPWVVLSPRYKRVKEKKRPGAPMLKLDFHMLGDQLSHQVIGQELFVGTNAKYGAIHHFGGTVKIPARSQDLFFKQDKRTGEVGNRFVKRGKSNFAQTAKVAKQEITIPARPWLGLSTQDETDVLEVMSAHLRARLSPGTGG